MAAPKADFANLRRRMIETIEAQFSALTPAYQLPPPDPRVLDVMTALPRHIFIPQMQATDTYVDAPLEIGHGQTISQPLIVALMSTLARVGPSDKVLEVGTGSGYQTAVLAALATQVFSIELVDELAVAASGALRELNVSNVTTVTGDGHRGWSEHAPFDAIVVTAAPASVPETLIDQLAPGGRLVIPVGQDRQELLLVEKDASGTPRRQSILPVRFVPLTGRPA